MATKKTTNFKREKSVVNHYRWFVETLVLITCLYLTHGRKIINQPFFAYVENYCITYAPKSQDLFVNFLSKFTIFVPKCVIFLVKSA